VPAGELLELPVQEDQGGHDALLPKPIGFAKVRVLVPEEEAGSLPGGLGQNGRGLVAVEAPVLHQGQDPGHLLRQGLGRGGLEECHQEGGVAASLQELGEGHALGEEDLEVRGHTMCFCSR
jgi:hypothetical protein